jgi:hypothetical protein
MAYGLGFTLALAFEIASFRDSRVGLEVRVYDFEFTVEGLCFRF